jgi:hypothetical protein
MNEARTGNGLRQVEHIRGHLWHRYSIAVNQVLVATGLSFCAFSFGHCVVCSFSIYGFWLARWYLYTVPGLIHLAYPRHLYCICVLRVSILIWYFTTLYWRYYPSMVIIEHRLTCTHVVTETFKYLHNEWVNKHYRNQKESSRIANPKTPANNKRILKT